MVRNAAPCDTVLNIESGVAWRIRALQTGGLAERLPLLLFRRDDYVTVPLPSGKVTVTGDDSFLPVVYMDANLLVRPEIFDGVSRDQPCEPGQQKGCDPFECFNHGILLLPQIRLFLSDYMT